LLISFNQSHQLQESGYLAY